jgi:hypothetical protein
MSKKSAYIALILIAALVLCIVGGGIFAVHGVSHCCSHFGCGVCFAITQLRAIVSEICIMPVFSLSSVIIAAAVILSVHLNRLFSGVLTPVVLKVKLSS